ncbi:hypothetical protein HYH02_003988 [Chlamydomonas schloesseri]|uniref:EF-hand domain-containing protein n=1 Tax=Chlamydomonas schloesseri TaxID=2026947 RepID=A0A836B926_9CHLO|nr:hypothetical protein HYH02_003988 [Chlamydomonas schloesseri]|eukprot:KAG2451387.1 hypothetical protein HYH02_003988 [Chlamydomonas schloesseri]
MSTLDKVFEYFSSQEKDKHKFLTDVDLLRAIVPTYPPSESHLDRSGSLDGERQNARPQPFWSKAQTGFFKQFDVDGDGLISYPEFLLVLTLLSIHERDVKTIFDVVDLDGNGQIDAEEFKAVMELLQAMANVHTSKVGRSHKLSIDSESGILVSFFGKDGTKKLYLPEFQDFLTKLHEEVVKLEFAHYDNMGRGSMAPVDFARSLVATADVRQVDKLLDRVDALEPELLRKRISFDDFLKVHQVERRLHTLQVALDFFAQVGRSVTKPDFVKLLKKLLNVTLPPHVVDIIFAVFTDDKGNLDISTFLEVMQRREIMWGRRKNSDTDGYPPGTLSRAMVCMRKCFYDE